jgi:hypothetical protein
VIVGEAETPGRLEAWDPEAFGRLYRRHERAMLAFRDPGNLVTVSPVESTIRALGFASKS